MPVTAFLPELHAAVNGEPLMRPVTVRDLLTHSSGLGMSLDGTSWALAHSRLNDTLAERMTRWSGQTIPADFQPGTAAAYSPVVGFELLGRILELAGGKPLDALLRETVLAPLGMVRTGFPDSTQGLARLCQPRSGVLCDVTDEPRRHRRCGFLHRQTHRAACVFRILSAARSPLSHTESGLFRRFLLQAAQ